MSTTLRQLLEARAALISLSVMKLPALSAYRIARLIQRLNPEFVGAETGRVAICREFGTEDGGNFNIPAAALPEFTAKMDAYLATETDVDAKPLPFDAVADAQLTPADMLALEPFLEEPK